MKNNFILLGEKGRRVFLERVCDALETYGVDFEHRKAWADLLRTV